MTDENSNQQTVEIRYIKNKRRKEDNVNKTKIVWHGQGDVQNYPRHLAPALLQHSEVFVIAGSENDPFASNAQTRTQSGRNEAGEGEGQAPLSKGEEAQESQQAVSTPKAKGFEVVELQVNDVEVPPGAYYVMLVPGKEASQMELAVGAIQQIAAKAGYSVPAVAIEGELFRIKSDPAPVATEEYHTETGTETRISEVVTPETVDSLANEDKDTLKSWASEHLYIDLNKRFSNEKLVDQMRLAAEIYQSELAYVGDPSMFKDAYKQSLQAHDMFNPEIARVL